MGETHVSRHSSHVHEAHAMSRCRLSWAEAPGATIYEGISNRLNYTSARRLIDAGVPDAHVPHPQFFPSRSTGRAWCLVQTDGHLIGISRTRLDLLPKTGGEQAAECNTICVNRKRRRSGYQGTHREVHRAATRVLAATERAEGVIHDGELHTAPKFSATPT